MLSRLYVHKNKFLAVVALAFVMAAGFGVREALSADADLQQYNGSAVWADDLTAASTLLPRDGKRITADSNAVGSAPVNRSLKQIKDYMIAMHRGIFGVGGTGRRTVYSLDADGVGGQSSTLDPAWIASTATNDRSLITPDSVSVLDRGVSGGQATLTKGVLSFINTVDGGGNPAKTAPRANKVMPLNTAKVWVNITTSGGVIFHNDGYNVTSVSISAGNKVTVNFASGFDNTLYACISPPAVGPGGAAYTGVVDPADKATGSVKITYGVNPATTDLEISMVCFGRQTT